MHYAPPTTPRAPVSLDYPNSLRSFGENTRRFSEHSTVPLPELVAYSAAHVVRRERAGLRTAPA